tara:strand:+ start:67 stop:273 length:207 start_codon:yes stop_codon:yes gene_type:complete
MYRDLKKLIDVDSKIKKNNEKIIFIEISYLISKIFDFKCNKPKIQNITKFKLVTKFPKIKLIGKKPKT